jgi:PD-(D/E)XK endonuclease
VLKADQKGNIAEAAIALRAIRLGFDVFKPLNGGVRYDLLFDTGSRMLRVQCKWARREGNVLLVRCFSCRRAPEGQRRRSYSEDEIDAIAAYHDELDRCYFIPVSRIAGRRQIQLRLAPTNNNQRLGLNWAHLFEFSAVDWERLDDLGAIARLGEPGSARRRDGVGSCAG